MKKLYVDTFFKEQSPSLGQSRPLLVQASDGNKYFIKNNMVRFHDGWKNENAAFFNEIISHKIAKYLGINTPDIAILEIEQDIMAANSDLLFSRRFNTGIYFGSQLITNPENNLLDNFSHLMQLGKPYISRSWNNYFNNISNVEIIPSIIAMDLLLANFDRFDNTGNLLISNVNGERILYAIDHGHCFWGPFYDSSKESQLRSNDNLDRNSFNVYADTQIQQIVNIAQFNGRLRPFNHAGSVFKSIEQYIDLEDLSNHSFMDPIERIENLNLSLILEMISDIPDEWIPGKQSQIKSYSEFVYRQSKIVRYIIQRMANFQAFSNYRGGELQWKQENRTGTQ